ncbi:MAG: CotH kinase family protein [Verrucomicrobiales bacterium]|nr:CotH kinase family protein [Verrucomicrobiales bacterium]
MPLARRRRALRLPALLSALVLLATARISLGADQRPPPPDPGRPSSLHLAPFTLSAQPPTSVTWRYTLDGSPPSRDTGLPWTGSLSVSNTTVLRLVGFAEGSPKPSHITTRTYVFPRQVLSQNGAGFPTTWGVREGHPVPADYEMDPEIVGHPAYAADLGPALTHLASLSLVMAPQDLFGAEHGIYTHPLETGAEWERAASIELLGDPQVTGPVDGGIRIQGGWNRRPEESPKHAFRLAFRKRHGPAKWKQPLFGPNPPVEFDDLILRAGCNNTWLHWKAEERRHGDYLRDPWMRDTLAAMGHPSARGRFVHLYLNGLYWGIYQLTERPSAPFVAAHHGGEPEDYDVRNGSNPIEGDGRAWDQLMRLVETAPADASALEEIGRLVNLAQLADYILLNLYGANGDLDGGSNWYAARRHRPPGPFVFFVWDGERTLEDPQASTLSEDPESSPLRLFQRLRQHPGFRRLFAERARRHLEGDGALTPRAAAARYETLARTLDPAVVAESARWGDYRRDAHPYKVGPYELYTRDDHWRPEVQRLLQHFFPQRTAVLREQLRAAGLYAESP